MATALAAEAARIPNAPVDLRSDTVTRPTRAMRAAMAEAEVGDDVMGEDPTVARLESRVAALTGKAAALLFPTATQANLAAMMVQCGRGEQVITGASYHVFKWEAGGASVLGGIAALPLPVDASGGIDPDVLGAAILPEDPHFPRPRLLCLENTVGGRIQPLERLRALAEVARRAGLSVHLDGARLFNACVASGLRPDEVSGVADTVTICLSKGLGCPIGAVLAGPEALIAEALRARKILGGGMRQVGIFAAAGLHALDHHLTRLSEDHGRARRLAEGLSEIDALETDLAATQTNMVWVRPRRAVDADALRAHLGERGVSLPAGEPWLRLVTHLDIDDAGIERTVEGFRGYFAS